MAIDNSFEEAANSFEAQWRLKIAKTLQRLHQDLPELPEETEALGMGAHGITLDHGSGEISKIALRGDDEDCAYDLFTREAMILKLLQDEDYATARTPSVSHITPLDFSKEAIGSIRMEKFAGEEINWEALCNDENNTAFENHFRNIGQVIAEFHRKASEKLKDVRPLEKPLGNVDRIEQVIMLSQEVNQALRVCNDVLQKGMIAGVAHGDFHSKNFLVNERDEVTGIFDLSFAGHHANRCIDFSNIPDKALPLVLEEYERFAGIAIDPKMVALTKISQNVGVINYQLGLDKPDMNFVGMQSRALIDKLNELYEITGKTFDYSGNAVGGRDFVV